MNKLTGIAAIEYAEANDLLLNKHTDDTEEAREDVTPAEAREIASEDPSLIWIAMPLFDPKRNTTMTNNSLTPDQAYACLQSIGRFLRKSYGYPLHRFDMPTLSVLYPDIARHVRYLMPICHQS